MCQPNPTLGGLTHDILQCHLFLSHEATRPLPLMDMVVINMVDMDMVDIFMSRTFLAQFGLVTMTIIHVGTMQP